LGDDCLSFALVRFVQDNSLHKQRLARPISCTPPDNPTFVCRHPGFAEGEDRDPESPTKQRARRVPANLGAASFAASQK
jgi:hypothetical protein